MDDLKSFLDNNNLIDLDLTDAYFTWNNMQADDELIQNKLDRVVFSPTWLDKFLDYALISQINITSDHTPLLLQASPYVKKRAPFRFEAI